MLWRFHKAPKDLRVLFVKKPWHTKPKAKAALALTSLAAIVTIGSLLMPEAHAYSANAFVMVVKTDNPGTSNATSFTIPTTGAGYSYNVDCNDDGINEVTARTTSYTCVYATAGTYTVAITGTFPRVYFNNAGDREKLLEVKQWGTGAWTSMANAFYGCINMHVTATDAPNLAGVTSMASMFRDATSMNENINHWNVSTVTDMSWLFAGGWWNGSNLLYATFNQPLNNWNTSAVTDMSYMFSRASAFNQPLTNWNTAAVTNMSGMFAVASAFNQPLTNFNTAAVTDMSYMFSRASAFNQPLTNFNTAAVTDMSGMFYGASAFNQPLTGWNTSAVTNMSGMFSGASAFNQPLTGWNTSAVTNMSGMFDYSGYTTATYDQTLAHLAGQTLQPNVTLGALGATYCNDAARAILTTAPNNWTITDGGYCPPTITSPANLAVVATATPAVTGTATANRTVHIALDGGADTTVTAGTDGHYSYQLAPALTTGWHSVVVRSTDQAGTPGAPTNVGFYVHTGGAVSLSGPVLHPTVSWSAAPNTQLGTSWNKTAGDGTPSFTKRDYSTATSFHDKLWLFGGWGETSTPGTNDDLNDIWSSPDGVTWTKETSNAPWGRRDGQTVIEFNGKLWLFGGWVKDTSSYQNDIWSSTDGINWTRAVEHAPWSELGYYPQLAVLNNKLYLVDGNGSYDYVYSSSDGVNWTQVVDHAPFGTRWAPQMVAFNGKLWLMGGSGGTGDQNDIWSSPDGVNWTQEVQHAAWKPTSEFAATVFDNRIWLMGGWGGMNEVWFSADGKNWIQATNKADWPGRAEHVATPHNGKLWIMSGYKGGGIMYDDVWQTTDSPVTYTLCWDTVEGGCAHTATVNGTSFTLPEDLTKNTWYFKVAATGAGGQSLGSATSSPYAITDPTPVSIPLATQPVIHPVTGAASTVQLDPTLAQASLSISSYYCNSLTAGTVKLIEPDGLKAPEAGATLVGGVGFTVGCTENGKATDVALSLGASYADTTKLRAYKQTGSTLVDITSHVTFTNKVVAGVTKTVLSYNLVDGGEYDEDGVANGTIVDPIFIGVVGGAGGSLANTGVNIYTVLGIAAVLLTSAAVVGRKARQEPKRVSFR